MKLDRTDIRLLNELQQDGRRTVVELAETVGLTHTPCARRIRQLEQVGIIQGYAAIVDPARLGLSVQAFVQVRLERHTDENVEQFHRALESLPEVVAADLESFGTLVLRKLLKVPGVRDVQSSLVLDTLKRSMRIPLSHLLPQAKLDLP
jgi:Lrp/AsnC family leucine-responsive transcriptional regulator